MKTINQILNINQKLENFLQADWHAPSSVKTLLTTRNGGVSKSPYDSLNVGAHVGDNLVDVQKNREIVQQQIALPVAYLNQVHSNIVVPAADAVQKLIDADASIDFSGKTACAVMTADCLPVLFCNKAGTVVAAAHAGWRGLAGGVLENTVAAMGVMPSEILAYLGPAIGPDAFEVGVDVFDVFCNRNNQSESAFENIGDGKYLADIYKLAKIVLKNVGVNEVYGGQHCTVLERDTFFSYRRDGQTGRLLSAIWLDI